MRNKKIRKGSVDADMAKCSVTRFRIFHNRIAINLDL